MRECVGGCLNVHMSVCVCERECVYAKGFVGEVLNEWVAVIPIASH